MMRIFRNVLALMSLVMLQPAFAADSGGTYTLTTQYGSVLFRVFHQEYLYLVGRFDDYSGSLHLDPDNLANSSLTASVDMSSLNMADGDVTETLVYSSVWFNTDVFPQATFTSSSVEVVGENEVAFHGDLEFVGVTQPWTFHVEFHAGGDGELAGDTIGISGSGTINRLDFGLNQYRNLAADMVEIEVNAKFNKD